MANLYCTAPYTGHGFITRDEALKVKITAHPGNIWGVENNEHGVAWINKVGGTSKTKPEAEAIIAKITEESQARWDAMSIEDRQETTFIPSDTVTLGAYTLT